MANRTAKFASAAFLGILAGAPLTIAYRATAAAAATDGCLTEPKGEAPEGQHWRYRTERSTKQKCWYLRGEGDRSTRAASSEAVDKSAPQQTDEIEPTHSVADARAEYLVPQTQPAPTAPREPIFVTSPSATAPAATTAAVATPAPATTAPDASAGSSAIASRWPDPAAAIAGQSTASAPAAPQPVTQLATADATDATAATSSPAPAPVPTSDVPAAKTPVPLQMLFLVIFGALALAGLIASVIYRLGNRRRRRAVKNARPRRGVNWPEVERVRTPPPPWVEAPVADYEPRVSDYAPRESVDYARRESADYAPDEEVADAESHSTFSDLAKIEAFLAQMAKQPQMTTRQAQN